MLHILCGRADALWDKLSTSLIESYRQGVETLLLVPEQLTIQAEIKLLTQMGSKGFFNLQVLSPSRFQNRALERLGRDPRELIDDRGRLMTLARALEAEAPNLRYYQSAVDFTGFALELSEAISELKAAMLSPETLKQMAGEQDNPKWKDLACLYARYEALLEGKLMDGEDLRRDMLKRLKGDEWLKGAALYVYGFDRLNDELIEIIMALSGRLSRGLISLEIPKELMDNEVFSPVTASLNKLMEALKSEGIQTEFDFLEAETKAPQDISHLERLFLRFKRRPFEGDASSIRLYAAPHAHAELRRCAQEIVRLLDKGLPPGRICVALCGASGYEDQLPQVFSDYQIPFYIAGSAPVLSHPLVSCLIAALRSVCDGQYREEDVLDYLKSGFSPLEDSEVFEIENYALRDHLQGSSWGKPLKRGEESERERLEVIREKGIGPLVRLAKHGAKATNAQESIRAVLDFLNEIKAYEKAVRLEKRLIEEGMPEEAVRTRQVWEKLCGLFKQLNELMGSLRVPLRRFASWLEAGLSLTKLKAYPQTEDCVEIGRLGRLIPNRPRAVFLLGLNDGALSVQESGLLNDEEREQLKPHGGAGFKLSLNDTESLMLLSFWKLLSASEDKLYLSYALADETGAALRPLGQLKQLTKLFPGLIEEGGAAGSLREVQPLARVPALDEIALKLREGPLQAPWDGVWAWLSGQEGSQEELRSLLEASRGDRSQKSLDPGTAKQLFKLRSASASRFETQASCPFKHFVLYGLRPVERKLWELQSADSGSFCHKAMENFMREATQTPSWPGIDRKKSDRIMDLAIDSQGIDWEETPFADSPRAKKSFEKTRELCRHMGWSLTEAAQNSSFRPARLEWRFGEEGQDAVQFSLEDGSTVRLHGIIDRLDMAQEGDKRYLCILDYKSSPKQLKPALILNGVQLQLLLYGKAAEKALPDAEQAGMFYQLMRDPVVQALDEDEALRERRKALRRTGLALKDAEVIKLLDDADPPLTLPRLIKKDGSLTRSKILLSPEEMRKLREIAVQKATKLANQIVSGDISRSPYVFSRICACDYCEYQAICRRDRLDRERGVRRLSRKSFEELFSENP